MGVVLRDDRDGSRCEVEVTTTRGSALAAGTLPIPATNFLLVEKVEDLRGAGVSSCCSQTLKASFIEMLLRVVPEVKLKQSSWSGVQ